MKIFFFIILLLVSFDVFSQEISKNGRVELLIRGNDTLILINHNDAKLILSDLLTCQINDTILTEYKIKDSLNTTYIKLYDEKYSKLDSINGNNEKIITNLNNVVINKDGIIKLKDEEIRYQKKLKKLGFLGCIILPIITIFILN